MSELFHGTLALVATRRRALIKLTLWLGLVLGLASGATFRLCQAGPADFGPAVIIAALVAAAMFPLIAAGTILGPLGAPAGAGNRRDELLLLPCGRLALPAAILMTAALGLAAWCALAALGLSLTVGSEPLRDALGRGLEVMSGGWCALLFAMLFAQVFFLGSAGGAGGGLVLAANLVPGVVALSGMAMGYPQREPIALAGRWWAALAVLNVVLPFGLYLLPTSTWATTRDVGEGPLARAGFGAIVAAIAFVLAGLGWAMLAIAALTALQMWRAARALRPFDPAAAPARRAARPWSGLAVSSAALLGVSAPFIGWGWFVDHARIAAEVRGERLLPPSLVAVSPDLERRAVERRATDDTSDPRRYVFVDGGRDGPAPLPTCFADVDPAVAWSRDGRFLAVQDGAVGRLHVPGLRVDTLNHDELPLPGLYLVAAFQSATSTLVLDTTTGEVRRLDVRAIAPGWRTPDDLVHLGLTCGGTPRLEDGHGRVLDLEGDHGWPTVVAYDADGEPLLERKRDFAPQREVEGIGLVPASLWRWHGAGLVAVDVGARWSYEPLAVDPAQRPVIRKLRRAGVELAVEADRIFRLLPDALIACGPRGIERVALPGLERTLLLGWDGAKGPWTIVDALDPMRVLVGAGERWLDLDLRTGKSVPRDLGGGAPSAFSRGRILVSVGEEERIIAEDGSSRALP